MASTLPQLADELAADQATLERELAEIELLLRQTVSESERHEARRIQAEERVTTLERDDPGVKLDWTPGSIRATPRQHGGSDPERRDPGSRRRCRRAPRANDARALASMIREQERGA